MHSDNPSFLSTALYSVNFPPPFAASSNSAYTYHTNFNNHCTHTLSLKIKLYYTLTILTLYALLFVGATSCMVPYGLMVALPCIQPSGWHLGLLLQNSRLRISRLWNVCSCWHTLVQRAKFTQANWRECGSIIVQKNIKFSI